jgi:cytochrome c553
MIRNAQALIVAVAVQAALAGAALAQTTAPAAAPAAPAPAAAPAAKAEPKGDLGAARDKVSMCIGCHGIPGYKWAFPEKYTVPKIAGQSEKYIYNALQAYKKGDRTHQSMRAIAASLSDQDMLDLAAFWASMKK